MNNSKRVGNPNLKPLSPSEKSVSLRVRGDRGTLVFFEALTAEERGRVIELAFSLAPVTTTPAGRELFALLDRAMGGHIAAVEALVAREKEDHHAD